jgi:hypothetical protein
MHTSPVRPSMGHIPNGRPCNSRRRPKTDPFPPTRPLFPNHRPMVLDAGEYHKSAALLYRQTAADRSSATHPPAILEAQTQVAHRPSAPQISRLAMHQTAADISFPPNPCRTRGIHPGCSSPGIPQIGGLAMPEDRRRQILSQPPSRYSRGTYPSLFIAGEYPKSAALLYHRTAADGSFPLTRPPFPRHSTWVLVAGEATNRQPCDATRPPQTDPSHPFPVTLEAITPLAHRRA